ncbi:MAG: polysaccharide biosynthesis/export family protein [Rhodospirillales bacterium]|nr:polysaccharide biosynthesis/export family protein [Alphaproteobacteria bacterium]MCB9986907.1 polysaccharide biosynthesis/export family protein [Rhodospirillales bacterium]USO08315.1 MAG: polysaccharide biosynthesis/export family protein [Rhodospirillales bacterium]
MMSIFIHRVSKYLMIFGVLVLAGCCNHACAPAAPMAVDALHKPQPVSSVPHVIVTGDVLKVTVFGESDLSGDYIVGEDGEIAMPLIGAVEAAGQTLESLPGDIAGAYRAGYLKNPNVTVELKSRGAS